MNKKFKSLFIGKRPFPKRLFLAAGPTFTFSFTLFFFGPLDLAYLSRNDITYSALDILPYTALIMGIVFLILLLAAAVPGGQIHAFLVSLFTGCNIALYVQGAFLNPDLGTLDGHTVNWPGFSSVMLGNLALWFIILLIPHLIHGFSNRIWRRFTVFISIVLVLMQGVSLETKLFDQIKIDRENHNTAYISKENMFRLGKKQNVIIFLLDTVSDKDIERTVKEYPDILYQFRDFTRFDNANSRFLYTVPSVVDSLTAYDPIDDVFDLQDHMEKTWKNPEAVSFYTDLREKGFQTNLYIQKNIITTGNLNELSPFLSNILEYGDDIRINRSAFLNLFKLSFYRYLPIAAKPFFSLYTDDINQIIISPNALVDQWDFVREIMDADLEIGESDNVFSYYYLQGSHRPYTLNDRGYIEGDYSKLHVTNDIQQTAGFLNMLGLYMWRMKTKEIYDDSTIIIMADHGSTAGNYYYDSQPIFWIKPPHQIREEMEINHAPITTQTQLLPTIAGILGLSGYDYGDSVFDIKDEPIERWTRIYAYDSNFPTTGTNKTNNVIYEYHYVGGSEELVESFRNGNMKIYPMTKTLPIYWRKFGMMHHLQKFVKGKRPFPKRLRLALAPALALSLSLTLFGTLDFTYTNRNFLSYTAADILPVILISAGIVFLLLLLAASVPGGKVHAFLLSAYVGISTAMYIQKAFLNPDFGGADISSINWKSFSTMMIINLALWFIILVLPHLIHYFSNRAWRIFTIVISIALILAQGISLTGKFPELNKSVRERTAGLSLSDENMLHVGSRKNIIVFLLNETSTKDLKSMTESYPELMDSLKDFTWFDNPNSHYMFTFPSLVNLLTGQEWNSESERISEYMYSAWNSEQAVSFFQSLADNGYARDFYLPLSYITKDTASLQGMISNLKQADSGFIIDREAMLNLYKLSFCQQCPIMLKPFFMLPLSDAGSVVSRKNVWNSEWDFINAMNKDQILAGREEQTFKLYYLQGSQWPYDLDETGHPKNDRNAGSDQDGETGKNEQLAGIFTLIGKYMDQLRNAGLYEEAGIIILSDHGNNADKRSDHQPVYLIKHPGEQHETITAASAPITIQDCFLADVAEMSGIENGHWGNPSGNVTDDPVDRWTMTFAKDNSFPDVDGAEYNVMREYRYDRDGDYLIEQWIASNFNTVPIIDSFY